MPQFPRVIDTGTFGFNYARFLGLGLLILFVLYLCATVVPAGHVGVKDFFGSVSDRALGPRHQPRRPRHARAQVQHADA